MRRRLPGILLLQITLSGCMDNQLGIEKRVPNRPPQTILSGGPIDFAAATDYRVGLSWWGSDPDGAVDHFDFILIDHPAAIDSIGAGFAIDVPGVDDPRWLGTQATDSVFVTLADTLRQDPQGSPPADVLRQAFERWHTFFVRAVDDEGLPDPTPDYLSFNAVNLAPTAGIRRPVSPGLQFQAPPAIFFSWSGADPVGDGSMREPVASRWVMIPSAVDSRGRYTSWPDSLYHLPTRYSWSPWHRWDAADSAGVRALVRGLAPIGTGPGTGYYIFAVQARDEAGAVTPVFDTTTPGKNNAVLLRVSYPAGPTLLVEERFLGAYTFVGNTMPFQLDVAAGQPIRFQWHADASQYGGEVGGYRYGWNVRDPGDDSEWSGWSRTTLAAPTHAFVVGTQRFYLQARDNVDNITSIVFELTPHAVTLERDLLWVDDTAALTYFGEADEDARWLQVFTELAAARGFAFFPPTDVYDVAARGLIPPPIDYAFRYKVIVWSVRNGSRSSSGLRTLAQFLDPFARRNRNLQPAFNYLSTYLEHGGKLWINGFRPALQVWPQERKAGTAQDAVNVTNWDDPIDSHPFVDSVGTTSLLYRLGIEMFDVGAATGAARSTVPHFCSGLQRFVPADFQAQEFESTRELDHSHWLEIGDADIESATAEGLERQTSAAAGHRHLVRLTAELRARLRAGETVRVLAVPESLPAPHVHEFALQDRVGFWGAPVLSTGEGWGFRAGEPGRPNVEIYNMPSAMATQHPALAPVPGLSTVLYTYRSAVPSGPGVVYPQTADGEPVCVLTRTSPSAPFYAAAVCGFEPHLLLPVSHRQLVEFIVVRHFRLGTGAP